MNAYQALFETNIQVDFVHPDELVSGTAPYVVLYVPNPAGATPATAAALSAFATGGGTLIIERSSNPSTHTLDDLFDRDARPWTNDAVPTTRAPGGAGANAAESRVQVAAHGSGRVFLAPPPAMTTRAAMARARTLIQRIVTAAGVAPEIELDVTDAPVEARFLESSDAILLLALNYGGVPQKVTFSFAPDVPEAIWQNMETGAAVNFRQGPEGATYTRTLAAGDVMVLVRGKRLR